MIADAAFEEAERVARRHVYWCIANGCPLHSLLVEIGENPAELLERGRPNIDGIIAAVARAWLPVAHAGDVPATAPTPTRRAA